MARQIGSCWTIWIVSARGGDGTWFVELVSDCMRRNMRENKTDVLSTSASAREETETAVA